MTDRSVTTVGHGRADAVPDAVSVVLVVEVEGATPAEALDGCGSVQSAVVSALGVSASAGGLSVQPSWDQERNRPGKPVAVARITAHLPDLTGAGAVVTSALQAGGKAARLESLTPVVSDPSAAVADARAEAFAKAQAAAEQYAELAGRHLGDCLEIAEGARSVPGGVVARAGRKANHMESYDVAGGAQDLLASVTVTWSLAD